MLEEQALSVAIITRTQRLSRHKNTGVHIEGREKVPHPLPVISTHEYPEDSRVKKVNFLLAGTYGLSLAYDELIKKIFDQAKKSKKKTAGKTVALAFVMSEVDEVAEYSIQLSQMLSSYLNGQEDEVTRDAEAFVEKKTQAVLERTFPSGPPQQEKHVDPQLGLDRFLQSEVLSMGIDVHDIRTPLTIFKGKAQLLLRRGSEEIDQDFFQLVKERQSIGAHMRAKLLSSLPMQSYAPKKVAALLCEYVSAGNLEQQADTWNIVLPDSDFLDFPDIMFNEHMLYSIMENAFTNAQKGRKVLYEQFGKLLATLFLAGESWQAKYAALRGMQRIHDRLEQIPTFSIAIAQVVLRRRPYAEIVFRDNGIGNDAHSGRRQWRRNFFVGESDWSGSKKIVGTGIAMGTHRQRIKELFPHTHADMFLRNRTDGNPGAEVVIRLPGENASRDYK